MNKTACKVSFPSFFLFLKIPILLCTRLWYMVSPLQLKGARGLVFRRGGGRYIRSQLLQVITGHKFCQFPARVWRARRVVAICERSAPVARRRGMKLRLPTPLHPSATITLVVKTAIRRTSQGGGCGPSSCSSSSPQPHKTSPRSPRFSRSCALSRKK